MKEILINEVKKLTGLSNKKSKALVDRIFELIKNEIISGKKVSIRHFGSFLLTQKDKQCFNPKTKEKFVKKNCKRIHFKPSKFLK